MLKNQEGKRVPDVVFHTRVNNEWKDITTEQLFKGKTVVLFSLPGAFTPTCSSTHLPRYNELAPAFKANGVDSVLCVSVNDTFVMNEWALDQEAANLVMVPDGNGEFTAGMEMLVDKSDLGFGKRSWRYSMLVKDGVVAKMFIEPEEPGDPFKVSDADTMLDYINPQARKPAQIVVFSKPGCSFCARAKAELSEKGLPFVDVPLDNKVRGKVLGAVSGAMTAPQVFINGELVGGADALTAWLAAH
ncbi:glutathione peroxidase [Paludibacterium yongneupense]|uniref:glutathione peroxidase n=1 Tax=Paludibacterium yongneupense TaxID=400061 RepID=UPI00040526CD|nr:glutathione peroxidase [Paludibacterium yongneupense]